MTNTSETSLRRNIHFNVYTDIKNNTNRKKLRFALNMLLYQVNFNNR